MYAVDGRASMLPRLLSERVCTLAAGEDRLAFAVVLRLLPDGSLDPAAHGPQAHAAAAPPQGAGRPWMGRAVIHPCATLSYEEAQLALEGGQLQARDLASGLYSGEHGHTMARLQPRRLRGAHS